MMEHLAAKKLDMEETKQELKEDVTLKKQGS